MHYYIAMIEERAIVFTKIINSIYVKHNNSNIISHSNLINVTKLIKVSLKINFCIKIQRKYSINF